MVHHGGVDGDLGERVESVDPMVPPRAGSKTPGVVGAPALLARELPKAVVRPLDVPVAVHLEHVAKLAIDEEPADRKVRAVLHRQELFGIAALDELADGRLDALPIHLGLAVDRERVVHVEPDRFDLVEPHVAVAVDPTAGGRRKDTSRGGFELGRRKTLLQGVAQLSAG